MFKNYVIIAFRNIRRNLSYAFLNVFGLTLGIAACLVIFLIVRNELNYDDYSKANRTYRVTLNAIDFNSDVSLAVAPAMRADFPELEQVSQVMYSHEVMVKVNNNRFRENDFAFADEHLPAIFNFQWISGDPKTALKEPNSIVLTESLAKKYYGDKNPMGEVINIENQINAKVTGVIKDLPGNRSLPLQLVVSLETIKKQLKEGMANFWDIGGGYFTFILLPPHYSLQQIQRKIPAFLHKNWGLNPKEVRLPLQPLKAIHFDQRYINNTITPTSKDTYYALFGVALLIIITACINFINLATAQAIKRAKEVGVRKVLGAHRSQLIKQFMGETTILILIALFLGVVIASLFLSEAGNWLNIKIDAHELKQPLVVGVIAGLTVLVILLAGLYPAFVQSAYQPIESLKNSTGTPAKGFTLRKGLVVAQFAISQILIVGTLVVAHQMDYFQNQDLGFNKDAIISFNIPNQTKKAVLTHYLVNNPGVKQVAFSSGAPSYNTSFAGFSAPDHGITKDDVTEIKFVDENFTDMFGLKMLAGQKISKVDPKDTVQNIVANETLIHKVGIMDPEKAIGQHIMMNGRRANIIGVMQDFQSESKHKKRRACVLMYYADAFFMVNVKLQPAAMSSTIENINKTWSALFPDNLFEYQFLDEHIASFYTQEQKVYTAFRLFSSIAILIGCLGLYGLISFAAAQRTREVGIRKVLGAPLLSIVGLFSKEFILLIAIAFFIAAPVGFYAMHNWLQNYAYHVNIGTGTFLIAIAASIVIAAITISYQTIKAALVNPVKSLRSE
ncbi:ABC transporter permease [Mucilaginibacter sp. X4EP1]|uniref:ABC transporter permease n=1 Tax=Mucilaginibacter sp. X4EP1 TaxID=2723092 RepID=UPI0021687F5A|nr:ABC transporter permease [Mucilaginibacter sp. X4EP1]MCS3813235.1 ABC-type antimicrobial peptide transport system permease subunit [Mucilaginibacter sp. X4EP1]